MCGTAARRAIDPAPRTLLRNADYPIGQTHTDEVFGLTFAVHVLVALQHPRAHAVDMSADPQPDPYDEINADLLANIDRYGYTMIVVGTGECSVPGCTCQPEPYPYAYSLGLIDHDHPELVTFGVPRSHVNTLARPVYEAAAAGRALPIGRQHRHQLEGGPTISLVPVPELWVRRDPGRIGGWLDVYSASRARLPSFVQICWSDVNGALPWEPECDPDVAALQPILADDPLRYPRPPRNSARHHRRRR